MKTTDVNGEPIKRVVVVTWALGRNAGKSKSLLAALAAAMSADAVVKCEEKPRFMEFKTAYFGEASHKQGRRNKSDRKRNKRDRWR